MDQLAAMRPKVDARAVYDANTHADLKNTGKYADLHAALWQAFVPEVDKLNSRLHAAASALLYVQAVYDLWLDSGWSGNFTFEFQWLREHCEDIDRYAAEGTAPTRHIIKHFIRRRAPDTPPIRDTTVLRNLHRVKDVATLFAYWTIMRDYELLAEHMLKLRIEKAVLAQAACRHDLGVLCCVPLLSLINLLYFMCRAT